MRFYKTSAKQKVIGAVKRSGKTKLGKSQDEVDNLECAIVAWFMAVSNLDTIKDSDPLPLC